MTTADYATKQWSIAANGAEQSRKVSQGHAFDSGLGRCRDHPSHKALAYGKVSRGAPATCLPGPQNLPTSKANDSCSIEVMDIASPLGCLLQNGFRDDNLFGFQTSLLAARPLTAVLVRLAHILPCPIRGGEAASDSKKPHDIWCLLDKSPLETHMS